MALGFAVALLASCATYPNQHGGASTGVRGNFDLDVLGVGVDGSAQLGVHRAGMGQRGVSGATCGPTEAAMQGAEGLMAWASSGYQGEVNRRAQASAGNSANGAGFNCSAQMTGQSRQVGGQEVLQMQNQYQQQQFVPQQQYQGGNRRSYYAQ